MNSKRINQTGCDTSSPKELQDIMTMYDFIASREDLKQLHENGMNEFIAQISLLAIRAVIDAGLRTSAGNLMSDQQNPYVTDTGSRRTGISLSTARKNIL